MGHLFYCFTERWVSISSSLTHKVRDRRRHLTSSFDSVAKKNKRSEKRSEKRKLAEKTGLPTGRLLPVVHCNGYRHKLRCRKGKGYSLGELKEANIGLNVAKILNISVDIRRNSSHEMNITTLQDFMSKIVVDKRDLKNPNLQGYPSIIANSKKEQPADRSHKKHYDLKQLYPVDHVFVKKPTFEMAKITGEMKQFATIDAQMKILKKKKISNRNKYDKAAELEKKKREEMLKNSKVKKIKEKKK